MTKYKFKEINYWNVDKTGVKTIQEKLQLEVSKLSK